MPEIITPSRAAKELNVTPRWVTMLLNENRLKGQKIDGKWYVDPEDLKRYMEKHGRKSDR